MDIEKFYSLCYALLVLVALMIGFVFGFYYANSTVAYSCDMRGGVMDDEKLSPYGSHRPPVNYSDDSYFGWSTSSWNSFENYYNGTVDAANVTSRWDWDNATWIRESDVCNGTNWTTYSCIRERTGIAWGANTHSPLGEGCYQNETGQDPSDLVMHIQCSTNQTAQPSWPENNETESELRAKYLDCCEYHFPTRGIPKVDLNELNISDEAKRIGIALQKYGYWTGTCCDKMFGIKKGV